MISTFHGFYQIQSRIYFRHKFDIAFTEAILAAPNANCSLQVFSQFFFQPSLLIVIRKTHSTGVMSLMINGNSFRLNSRKLDCQLGCHGNTSVSQGEKFHWEWLHLKLWTLSKEFYLNHCLVWGLLRYRFTCSIYATYMGRRIGDFQVKY